MRIYLSGPMTGMPNHNIPEFNEAAKRLREQGHFVINPAELSALFGPPDAIEAGFRFVALGMENVQGADYSCTLANSVMSADLAAVRSCDAIYLLRGWETSHGAKKELAEAIKHGVGVVPADSERGMKLCGKWNQFLRSSTKRPRTSKNGRK